MANFGKADQNHFGNYQYIRPMMTTFYRFLWFALIATVWIVFFVIIGERASKLRTHPKAVNVELIQKDRLEFPTVTICNHNFFRSV